MGEILVILLDQNVPRAIGPWLLHERPGWSVFHAAEVGLSEGTDRQLFDWAQTRSAVIITFDEDFADQRSFPVGLHHGVIRLHVWPTTVEETRSALARLLSVVSNSELRGSLVIVDRIHIRVRRRQPSASEPS